MEGVDEGLWEVGEKERREEGRERAAGCGDSRRRGVRETGWAGVAGGAAAAEARLAVGARAAWERSPAAGVAQRGLVPRCWNLSYHHDKYERHVRHKASKTADSVAIRGKRGLGQAPMLVRSLSLPRPPPPHSRRGLPACVTQPHTG